MTNAFVTLYMGDWHYIYGALSMAYSLRCVKTQHKIVCMITDDLLKYKETLDHVFDEVVVVPYLSYTINNQLGSKKQNNIYSKWKSVSYTKWQCLSLTKYSKVCFLDADLIIQKNIDHLFELNAPAGCWGNNWDSCVNYYDEFKYSDNINDNSITKGLCNGYLVNGHCVILDIEKNSYEKFISFMESTNYIKSVKCLAMYDEVSIVKFTISEGKQWTQIGKSYNVVPWKSDYKNDYILHYFNIPKPWQMKRGKWNDLKLWYDNWDSLIKKYPKILNTIKSI
jgi:lipopolysaccharide biosynthesis glycosyltransferase